MAERVLILGGTREAVALAADLTSRGHDVTTSLAGRTKEPHPPCGRLRVGGFGGVDGLRDYLVREGITCLIDATHPFAMRISENATAAARLAGVPLERRVRPPWTPVKGDRWERVETIEHAARTIPGGERVLLALGSQHIAPFAARADVHFVVRMVDPPPAPLPLPNHSIVLGRPSIEVAEERALLAAKRIERIVCRNSGGTGAYAKLVAARDLEIPVTMIERPVV